MADTIVTGLNAAERKRKCWDTTSTV